MKAIILAGGLGTRLRERVADLPKPMASIAGRPFLDYLLERLAHAGITAVTLSVGYKWEAIQTFFGTSNRGMALHYAIEDEPLGTGGAIVHALRENENESLLILNGDTFLDIDLTALIDWYETDPTPVAMIVRAVPDISRYGSVTVENGRVTGFQEKGNHGPGYINAGVYFIQPNIFSTFQDGQKFSFETDFLQPECARLAPRAWCSDSYFIDIGVPEDFDRAQTELPPIVKKRIQP
jgi:D-glycero-alpha-D-manno-heptose 1-phosphate guanylyltransferase